MAALFPLLRWFLDVQLLQVCTATFYIQEPWPPPLWLGHAGSIGTLCNAFAAPANDASTLRLSWRLWVITMQTAQLRFLMCRALQIHYKECLACIHPLAQLHNMLLSAEPLGKPSILSC